MRWVSCAISRPRMVSRLRRVERRALSSAAVVERTDAASDAAGVAGGSGLMGSAGDVIE